MNNPPGFPRPAAPAAVLRRPAVATAGTAASRHPRCARGAAVLPIRSCRPEPSARPAGWMPQTPTPSPESGGSRPPTCYWASAVVIILGLVAFFVRAAR